MTLYSLGDYVQITMPDRKDQFVAYRYVVVEGGTAECPFISPRSLEEKPEMEQTPDENPWRVFVTTLHGLRVGFGDKAKTYPLVRCK